MPLNERTKSRTLGGSVKCDHIDDGDVKRVNIHLDDEDPPHTIKITLCNDCWVGFVAAVQTANSDSSKIVKVE